MKTVDLIRRYMSVLKYPGGDITVQEVHDQDFTDLISMDGRLDLEIKDDRSYLIDGWIYLVPLKIDNYKDWAVVTEHKVWGDKDTPDDWVLMHKGNFTFCSAIDEVWHIITSNLLEHLEVEYPLTSPKD